MTWDPDWVVHPGSYVQEFMDDNGPSLRGLAIACGRMQPELLQAVIDGPHPLTPEVAARLQQGTQIPARLLLNLDRIFQAGLAAGKTWMR